jgi:DNA-binding NtrC family response regulator
MIGKHKINILVIEDDSVMLDYLKIIIPKIIRCTLYTAQTEEEIKTKIHERKYDVIFSDLSINGSSVDKIILSSERADIGNLGKMILVSAKCHYEIMKTAEKMRFAGMEVYRTYQKPVFDYNIKDSIKNALAV